MERREDIALDLPSNIKRFLRKRLNRQGVRIRTGTRVLCINNSEVVVESIRGIERLAGFEGVIAALGFKTDNSLVRQIGSQVNQVIVIGDAAEPREITDALSDALDAARSINA